MQLNLIFSSQKQRMPTCRSGCGSKANWNMMSYPTHKRPVCIPRGRYCSKWWASLTGDRCHCPQCGDIEENEEHFELKVELTPPISDYLNPSSPAEFFRNLLSPMSANHHDGYKVTKIAECGCKDHTHHNHPPPITEPITDIYGNQGMNDVSDANDQTVWIFTKDGCNHCMNLMTEAKKDGINYGYFETVSGPGCDRFKNIIGHDWNTKYTYPQMFVNTKDQGWYRVGGLRDYRAMKQSIKNCLLAGNNSAKCFSDNQLALSDAPTASQISV